MHEKKHINYSAADIGRYHKGGMSPKEMHALEKAALDDPFLTDALEGFAAAAVNSSEDISVLEKKLDERINNKEEGKVVPLPDSNRSWLRIAALLVIIGGAGLVTYQYALKEKTNDVAKTESKDLPNINRQATDTPQSEPVVVENKNEIAAPQKKEKLTAGKAAEKTDVPAAAKERRVTTKQDSIVDDREEIITQPDQAASAAPKEEEKKNKSQNELLKKSDAAAPKTIKAKQETADHAEVVKDKDVQNNSAKKNELNEVAVTRNFSLQNNRTNIFRGQVLDVNNSPLPFANVTNIQDNVGTYTDVKGNFVLVSPDSTLQVQVRSVGFENNISQLRNSVASNAVVLQQDTRNIPATVISNQKINSERKQQGNMVLEEPEPADGWYYYDTYLANNINIPDEIKTKKGLSGKVELSFAISRNGEPISIKVEKSVCKECDAEAIRLLKDGPKWKKKNKNTRAKVAVAF